MLDLIGNLPRERVGGPNEFGVSPKSLVLEGLKLWTWA